MKTIRQTIEKWDEIYDLVYSGAPSAANYSWGRVKEVFGLKERPSDAIREFCEEWGKLTEEDVIRDEMDWPLVMKFIGDLLALGGLRDYAFYFHNGEVGILADVNREVVKKKGYDEVNGIAFVPVYDMEEVIETKDETPHQTDDDCYSAYFYGVIGIHECVNIENEERMIYGWWSDDYAASDEYTRELLVTTGSYHDWTSDREEMLEALEQDLDKFGERFVEAEYEEDADKIKESFKDCLKERRKDWEETCSQYLDPLGFADSNEASADFFDVLDQALTGYSYDGTDEAIDIAVDYLNENKNEK